MSVCFLFSLQHFRKAIISVKLFMYKLFKQQVYSFLSDIYSRLSNLKFLTVGSKKKYWVLIFDVIPYILARVGSTLIMCHVNNLNDTNTDLAIGKKKTHE